MLDVGFAAFPGWTGGPVDTAGRQIVATPTSEFLGRDQFRTLGWRLIADYNATHAHSSLDDATPLDSWLADDAEIRRVDDAELRQFWLSANGKWLVHDMNS